MIAQHGSIQSKAKQPQQRAISSKGTGTGISGAGTASTYHTACIAATQPSHKPRGTIGPKKDSVTKRCFVRSRLPGGQPATRRQPHPVSTLSAIFLTRVASWRAARVRLLAHQQHPKPKSTAQNGGLI